MRNLSPDLLKDLEEFASLMFSLEEISLIIETDLNELRELVHDPRSDAYKTFRKGRLQREAEVRNSIFTLAKNGSSPAQLSALKLIENAKMDDV